MKPVCPAKKGKDIWPCPLYYGNKKAGYMSILRKEFFKKIATLFLLSIFCFNWIGYRLLFSYAENSADRQLEVKLDNQDYDPSRLLSIKLPASHLLAYVNTAEFERADGQIEFNAACYNYVKIRIFNDSIELLCIPNPKVSVIRQAKDYFFKFVTDMQQRSKSDHGNRLIKIIYVCYLVTANQFLSCSFFNTRPVWTAYQNELARSFYSPVIENPPE